MDLAVGQKCNSSCVMCTTPRTKDLSSAQQMWVPLHELKRIIDNCNDDERITITGGEATIRPDFFELMDYIKEKKPNTYITLISNGRIFQYPSFCKKLKSKNYKFDKIITEIHGHDATLHDLITRSKGSFKQTMNGIRNIQKLNYHVEIRVVIHNMNYAFLEEISRLITKYFKNVSIVYLYFDIIGSSVVNKDKLVIGMKHLKKHLEVSAEILKNYKFNIYHVPLCIIDKKYHDIAKGRTVGPERIYFNKECDQCLVKNDCPGIWRSYKIYMDTNDFKPILK